MLPLPGIMRRLAIVSALNAAPAGAYVGGVSIGTAGAAGSIYDGFTLADGDDFDTLSAADFLRPGNNAGTLMTPRNYGIQSSSPRYNRGAGSLGGYNTDPWHTGFADVGRGVVPADYADSITWANGVLKLRARRATSAERLTFGPLNKTLVTSSVHLGRRSLLRAPCMVECSMRFPYALASWDQWHPTFWLIQAQPGNGWDGLELDAEGFSPNFIFNRNTWANGVGQYGASLGQTTGVSKTTFRTYTFRITQDGGGIWTAYLYENGALLGSGPCDYGGNAFDPTRPFLFMWTNHALQANLTQSVWDAAGADGASIEIDWWRAWRPATGTFRKPLVQQADLKADFNTAFSFALPSAATVWGSGVTTDVLESIQNEDNGAAKGSDGTTLWRGLLPAGLTRTGDTLAGTISDQPGRLILARSATPAAGDGCQPQPVTLCIGPTIRTAGPLAWYTGVAVSWDVYKDADCGDLHVGKVVSVTGLPAGLSYTPGTGLVTGAPTATGSGSITVGVTNSAGQAASKAIAYGVTTLAVPSNSVAPAITGVMQVGQTLSATAGTWGPTPDNYGRQWYADNVAISGATAATYTLTSGELGKKIDHRVTATNAAGTSAAVSSGEGVSVIAATSRSYQAWTTLVADFDAANDGAFASATGDQAIWQNAASGKGALRSVSGAPTLSRVANVQNGKPVMRSVRGGGPTVNSIMESLASDPVAQAMAGSNKDFTLISVMRYTGATTSQAAGWSEGDTNVSRLCNIVRRSGSASSARYGTDSGSDIAIGAVANAVAVIAWKHEAGKSTVWVNSTSTKAADAVAQAPGTVFTSPKFSIGNMQSYATYGSTGLDGDVCHVVAASSARTEAEITAAVSELASLWGVTLS